MGFLTAPAGNFEVDADSQGAAAQAMETIAGQVVKAVQTIPGNSSSLANQTGFEQRVYGFLFPTIPAGTPTTMIGIAFPLTTSAPAMAEKSKEELEVLAVFVLAGAIWMLPKLCADSKFCCGCYHRFLSRRLGTYFCIGLVLNLIFISYVIAAVPDISANDLFFRVVHLIEVVTDKTQEVCLQAGMVFAICIAYSLRQKIVALLGFDSSVVRADLRDCLTCFSMKRFSTIEVSILKASGLPTGFTSRSLFLRVILGVNEPLHSRPRDGCTNSMTVKERMQLNYDPEDATQKLSIVIKQQEVVGAAVAQLAPAVGAIAGAAAGIVTPLGPQGGGAIGAVAGIGTANSLGPEVARVDLSNTRINRLREESQRTKNSEPNPHMSTGPLVPWREEYFARLQLVPQGEIWIRISDLAD